MWGRAGGSYLVGCGWYTVIDSVLIIQRITFVRILILCRKCPCVSGLIAMKRKNLIRVTRSHVLSPKWQKQPTPTTPSTPHTPLKTCWQPLPNLMRRQTELSLCSQIFPKLLLCHEESGIITPWNTARQENTVGQKAEKGEQGEKRCGLILVVAAFGV